MDGLAPHDEGTAGRNRRSRRRRRQGLGRGAQGQRSLISGPLGPTKRIGVDGAVEDMVNLLNVFMAPQEHRRETGAVYRQRD